MALVPIIQPPIMKALTSLEERKLEMHQLKEVSQKKNNISFDAHHSCRVVFARCRATVGNVLFWKFNEGVWCG